jgi:hypothetical protein
LDNCFFAKEQFKKYFLLGKYLPKLFSWCKTFLTMFPFLLMFFLNFATGRRLCCSVQLLLLSKEQGLLKPEGKGSYCVAVDQQVMFVHPGAHLQQAKTTRFTVNKNEKP